MSAEIWKGEYVGHPASVAVVGSYVIPRLVYQCAVNPQDREGIFVAAIRGLATDKANATEALRLAEAALDKSQADMVRLEDAARAIDGASNYGEYMSAMAEWRKVRAEVWRKWP